MFYPNFFREGHQISYSLGQVNVRNYDLAGEISMRHDMLGRFKMTSGGSLSQVLNFEPTLFIMISLKSIWKVSKQFLLVILLSALFNFRTCNNADMKISDIIHKKFHCTSRFYAYSNCFNLFFYSQLNDFKYNLCRYSISKKSQYPNPQCVWNFENLTC